MKTTLNLYLKVNFSLWLCIFVVCKSLSANATEISPLFGLGQENFSFDILSVLPNDKEIKFEPNLAGVSRLGLNIGDFGIGVGFRGSTKDLDASKGSTNFFDLQLGYHQKNWGLDSFYQTYQGFYTSNTKTIQVFSDLKFIHYGLMARYSPTESDFTIGGLMDQSSEVKETAGRYYLVGGFRYHDMNSPTSLLLLENAGINTELENLRSIKVTSMNFGAGAGKYWVSSNKLFAGALLDLIGTFGLYDYTSTTNSYKSSYLTLSYDLKIGLGYSGDVHKFGTSFTADLTTLKTPGATFIRPSANRFMIYYRTNF